MLLDCGGDDILRLVGAFCLLIDLKGSEMGDGVERGRALPFFGSLSDVLATAGAGSG